MLEGTDVHVWRVSLEQTSETRDRFWQLLSRDEQARADQFYFEIDRRHFIVARGCLRIILARYLETGPAPIEFAYSDYGKPQVSDSTRYLKFSLAHSGKLSLYAFTRIGEIGVDIEHIQSEFPGEDIARRFFSPGEVTCILELPMPERNEAFFNCWTRKEAFIKAKGLGLSLPLNQFDVSLASAAKATLLHTRWDEEEARRWWLRGLDVDAGYVGAVAVEAQDCNLLCFGIEEQALSFI